MSLHDTFPLSRIKAGSRVMLVGFMHSRRAAKRLAELGLTPETKITVLQNRLGQPMLIRVRDCQMALDRHTAHHLQVRLVAGGLRHGRGRWWGRHRRRFFGRFRRGFRMRCCSEDFVEGAEATESVVDKP